MTYACSRMCVCVALLLYCLKKREGGADTNTHTHTYTHTHTHTHTCSRISLLCPPLYLLAYLLVHMSTAIYTHTGSSYLSLYRHLYAYRQAYQLKAPPASLTAEGPSLSLYRNLEDLTSAFHFIFRSFFFSCGIGDFEQR